MKKVIITLAAMLAVMLLATGCSNYQMVDLKYHFNTAVLALPDGSIVKGGVDSWRDYDDSDVIQLKIGGTTYYTHMTNVVLIDD